MELTWEIHVALEVVEVPIDAILAAIFLIKKPDLRSLLGRHVSHCPMAQKPRPGFSVGDVAIYFDYCPRRIGERVSIRREIRHRGLDDKSPARRKILKGALPDGELISQLQHMTNRRTWNNDQVE